MWWVIGIVVVAFVLLIAGVALFGAKPKITPELDAALKALGLDASEDRTTWFLDRGSARTIFYSPPMTGDDEPCQKLGIHWEVEGSHDLAPPAVLAHKGMVVRCWPAGGEPLGDAAKQPWMLPDDVLPGLRVEGHRSVKEGDSDVDRPLTSEQVAFAKEFLRDVPQLAGQLAGSEFTFDDDGFEMASIEVRWRDTGDPKPRLETALAWLRAVEAQLPGAQVERGYDSQDADQTRAALQAQGYTHDTEWVKSREKRGALVFEPPDEKREFNRLRLRWDWLSRPEWPEPLASAVTALAGLYVECWPIGGAPLDPDRYSDDPVQMLPADTLAGMVARGVRATDKLAVAHQLFDGALEQLAKLPGFSLKLDGTFDGILELGLCWPTSLSFDQDLKLAEWWLSGAEARLSGGAIEAPVLAVKHAHHPAQPQAAAQDADARADAGAGVGTVAAAKRGGFEPLVCQNCGAPMPVSETDQTTCPSCGHTAPLPDAYKALRDAKRMSAQDAARVQALAAEVSRPPPAWQRTAMIVGYAVGGATLAVMALGAVLGAIGGLLAGEQLGESVSKFLAVVGAAVIGLVSIPFVGEWLVAVALLHDMDLAGNIVTSPALATHYDLIAGVVLYLFGVVPIALAVRTQANLDGIKALQGKLAAQPSTSPGGGPCCRHCGAPLVVADDALVSRCLYCGADNLLKVPMSLAREHKEKAQQLDAAVQDAVAKHASELSDDRATTMGLMMIGVLLVPFVWLAGYVLHTVVLS